MLLAQDGSGVSTKINDGIDAGYLDGAILSIKNRKPGTLPRTITSLVSQYPDKKLFLDTHFYASQIAMTRPSKIPEYSLYTPGLTRRDFSAKKIGTYSQRIIDFQVELGLTNIILPSLTIHNFNDSASQISLQLYEASLDYIEDLDGETLSSYASLVIGENALADEEGLSRFLDELTLLEGIEGFYIIIERPDRNSPQWRDSRTLSNFMYIINTLSRNYEVICGFISFPGLVTLAAGANHIANGWHQTLRQYTGTYFMATGGRNEGKFRYASGELLTEILSSPDLQSIIKLEDSAHFIDPEYGEGRLDDPENPVFPPPINILHQWKVFRNLGEQIKSSRNPIEKLEELVGSAKNNAEKLQTDGVVLRQDATAHYEVWEQAIARYKSGIL